MKTKIFGILPLLLCTPSLMALTPEEADSNIGYSDFTVTIKEVRDSQQPDLYEFTINNYGDCYLSKENISQTANGGKFIESIENRDSVQDNFKTLIKPKEVCVLRSFVDTSTWKIQEGKFNDFSGTGYSIRNDVINIKGPYNFSITDCGDDGTEKLLKIDCEINQLQNLDEKNRTYYLYCYAIDMAYDGEDFCVISEHQNNLESITARFSTHEEIDPSKLTINNIDSFIMIDLERSHKDPFAISIFKLFLILLAGVGAFGIIFGTVVVVCKRIDKRIVQ